MDLTELKTQISKCFGDKDKIFANHPLNAERAQELIKEIWNSDYSFKEYLSFIEEYLRSTKVSEEHIKNQLDRVSNIEYYF